MKPLGHFTTAWLLALLMCCIEVEAANPQATPAGIAFFEKHVRPLLIERCYKCHAASAKKLRGGLLLDSDRGWREGGDSGPAIVPGKPDQSLLVQAVRYKDKDLRMPPKAKLTDREIQVLEQWVRMGAADPRDTKTVVPADFESRREHWAFQPIRDPSPPKVRDIAWAASSVDRFILAQLEKKGLQPAAAADKHTLIRRATFDLIGLPPSPDQIDAFLADKSRDAFARLVDRLLASPHYGERWGRHWLDVARYADNKGYVFFEEKKYPWAWTYRDYVIRSFNEDKPFDRFVEEQIAADQLDLGDDRRALAAMGFLTLGARFMNNTHDIVDDRIDVVMRGLMGLTVTCARCHDHKYDPITADDYYGLYGVFRSSYEPLVPPELLPSKDTEPYRKFSTGLKTRMKKLDDFIAEQRRLVIEGARLRARDYLMAVHARRHHPTTDNFMLLTEKGKLIPAMIHRWEVYLTRTKRSDNPVWRVWHAFAELTDPEFAESASAVYDRLFGKNSSVVINKLVRDAFRDSPPKEMSDVADRYAGLLKRVEAQWQRQLDADNTSRLLANDEAEAIRQAFFGPQSPPMIPRELSWGFLDLLPDRPTQNIYKKLLKDVEQWSINEKGAPARAMVLNDLNQPHDPVVFIRGNPFREGRSVKRRLPRIISEKDKTFRHGSGRLEMARAIVDPKNPLTARVIVNRVWMHHFGKGIVETPSDFGLRGSAPSHPQLLDWLATNFIKRGWSVKHLHRTIMNTKVYQQASRVKDESRSKNKDPENRLLWRFNRRRLGFEAMRDSFVAVSGSLDRSVGGRPVDVLSGFNQRRTVYGFVNRMDLPGVMRAFDFPEPAATSALRPRTTVAPQALFFLNSPFTIEAAGRVIRRGDVSSIKDPTDRIKRIHRLLFGRFPKPDELSLAHEYLKVKTKTELPSAWTYGYGKVDDATHRVAGFTELRHWTGERWQVGPRLPDPKIGWVFVDRNGGHPAATMDRCVIRRWTAPVDAPITISGALKHLPKEGNGVRARVVSSRAGVLGSWKAHHKEVATDGMTTTVEAGDTIDFVVDFDGHIIHDEHEWPVVIRSDKPAKTWGSQVDFRGGSKLDRWVEYVHALMMTNEFIFVD